MVGPAAVLSRDSLASRSGALLWADMTQGSPKPTPRNDAEYVRRLALAILSTLESKGLLTRMDVDTILHAAHLAALAPADPVAELTSVASGAPSGGVAAPRPDPRTPEAPAPAGPIGPAVLGTRWVKPPALAEAMSADTPASGTAPGRSPAHSGNPESPALDSPVLDSFREREEQDKPQATAPLAPAALQGPPVGEGQPELTQKPDAHRPLPESSPVDPSLQQSDLQHPESQQPEPQPQKPQPQKSEQPSAGAGASAQEAKEPAPARPTLPMPEPPILIDFKLD